MPEVSVHLADTEADFDAARALCYAWVDWQLKALPEHKDEILRVFEPTEYAKTVDNLHKIHARPKGGILLACLDEQPVGCVMYLEMEPDTAEVKRLFVDDAGRGHGLGATLLAEMFEQMRTDGYSKVRFSSARFLTHARGLYEKVGFSDIEHPADFPDHLKQIVYFMERAL
ncbi:MAG: GNAT family N-acetyltransferase [Paracoccaceae bacterium]